MTFARAAQIIFGRQISRSAISGLKGERVVAFDVCCFVITLGNKMRFILPPLV